MASPSSSNPLAGSPLWVPSKKLSNRTGLTISIVPRDHEPQKLRAFHSKLRG